MSFHYSLTVENTADIQSVIRARPFRLSVLQMYTYKFFATWTRNEVLRPRLLFLCPDYQDESYNICQTDAFKNEAFIKNLIEELKRRCFSEIIFTF